MTEIGQFKKRMVLDVMRRKRVLRDGDVKIKKKLQHQNDITTPSPNIKPPPDGLEK